MSISEAAAALRSAETSVSHKTRIMFHLRSLDSADAALALQECFPSSSVLLDHETAYILGQMKQPVSIPFLKHIAEDIGINSIVRHEAIEALGNFEMQSLVAFLEKYIDDPSPVVSESAVLAVRKLRDCEHRHDSVSKYESRDPAFPFEGSFDAAVSLFESGSIEDKYRAIFYFRDQNSEKSVAVLAGGFRESSALLRHEIAYVFGQMQNPIAVEALVAVLEDESEEDIVRHEAAEALGNIGSERATETLARLLSSKIDILRESAEVGLGISSIEQEKYVDVGP